MRRVALALIVLGIVAAVIGSVAGCGALFSWNGRHAVAVEPIGIGAPIRRSFETKPNRRYTIALHVVFARESVPESNGLAEVDARFPVAMAIEDEGGGAVLEASGFLDPREPPTVIFGQVAVRAKRRPRGMAPSELVAERLLGPFAPRTARNAWWRVTVGTDQVGQVAVEQVRVVVYDDAWPPSIARAFAAGAAGLASTLLGVVLLLSTSRRGRRSGGRGGSVDHLIRHQRNPLSWKSSRSSRVG